MQKIITLYSRDGEKNINLKTYFPTTKCHISLLDVCYKNLTANIKRDSSIRFQLTLIKRNRMQILLPSISIPIPQGYFSSFITIKKYIEYYVQKATRYDLENQKFYEHALARLKEKNNRFYIEANHSRKRYYFELEFGEELKSFLNLEQTRLFVTNGQFLNENSIAYFISDRFHFKCLDIETNPISGLTLKLVHTNNTLLGGLNYVEFEHLEWRPLRDQYYDKLTFDWSEDIQVISFTVLVRLNRI